MQDLYSVDEALIHTECKSIKQLLLSQAVHPAREKVAGL
jgi:hypothetical protein